MQFIQDAMSIRYNTRIYEMKQRGIDVIVLSLGEAFFDLPALPIDPAACSAGAHYSHSRGVPELRETIARYHHQTHGFRIDPDCELIITAGSKIAIYMVMLGLLEEGQRVAIPEPAWVSYPEQARLCSRSASPNALEPVMIPCDAAIEEWERFLTPDTRLLVLSNPNNPAGRVLQRSEMDLLLEHAERHNLMILADEAYSAFTPGTFISFGRLDPKFTRVIICNSLSKNLGLSGWRIGYTIGAEWLTDRLITLNQHLITCAPTILQLAASEHFDSLVSRTAPQIDALLRRRDTVCDMLTARGLHAMNGDSTFYFFVSLESSELGSIAFCDQLLDRHRVGAVPGIGYGMSCDRFIRLSIGTEPLDRIAHALDCIRSVIDEFSPAGVHDYAAHA